MSQTQTLHQALLETDEPSRRIDAMIAVAVDWKFPDHDEDDMTPRQMAEKNGIDWLVDRMENSFVTMWRHIPQFTRSIDDAISVIENLQRCEFGKDDNDTDYWAYVSFYKDGKEYANSVDTSGGYAIAILSAYFCALPETMRF